MIEIEHLTKRYGKINAVSDLSFTIEDGQVVGLLGPNGAGKSTTMNILTGCLSATDGAVRIGGTDILEEPILAKKKLGYLPELPPLYGEMTVREYLSFVCDLKGVKKYRAEQIAEVCELVRISHVKDRLIKNLSKGYRQRVGLAQALINAPELLVLDEPTVGLDPKEILEILQLIRSIGQKHSVLISSHILSEMQAVCDKIVVINKGHLVANDTPENLQRSLSGGDRLYLRVRGSEDAAVQALNTLPGLTKLEKLGSKEEGSFDFTVTGDGAADLREPAFRAIAESGLTLLSMRAGEVSLEDIFLELTEEEVRA